MNVYPQFSLERLVAELRGLSERDTRTIPWSGIFRSVTHQAAEQITQLQSEIEDLKLQAQADAAFCETIYE